MTNHRSTRRRNAIAIVVIAGVIFTFVFRLVDLQIVQAHDLNAESYDKRSIIQEIPGTRGQILDSHGVVLASSVLRYNVTVVPKYVAAVTRVVNGAKQTVAPKQIATEIAAITGQSSEEIYVRMTADPESNYAVIVKSISLEKLQAIKALQVSWLYYETDQHRIYPAGSVAGNLVGFMGSDGQAQAGIELKENECLASVNGEQKYEEGGDHVVIPNTLTVDKAPVEGGNVVLTIDSDLQFFSQQALAQRVAETASEWGTAVVIEVKTGKLLTVAEYPTVDPNNVDATAPDFRGSLSFTSPIEPGSTFKAQAAATFIDAGVADPGTQLLVPSRYSPSSDVIVADAGGHAPERLTLNGIVTESSNVGMTLLGERLSEQQRYDYMKKFGLGAQTEVGFPGEAEGIIRTPEEWDDQTKHNISFGQGFSLTSVQNASIYQTLANGGVRLPVRLVEGCQSAEGTVSHNDPGQGQQVVSAAAAQQTVQMLESVAAKGYASKEVAIPGYRVGVKTGTAQVGGPDGKYGSLYLTSLAGIAPAENPQYVVVVSLMKPRTMTNALAAAPVFQQIMSHVLQKYRVLPSTEPAPNLPTNY